LVLYLEQVNYEALSHLLQRWR